jgi:tetratricopeptide (TPR) repeat protein
LLTSRHVACPWLEDNEFLNTAQKLLRTDITPQFDYRLFLWFEKQKAFNRAAQMLETSGLTDVYLLDAAYSSESSPRVSIVGVPKPPARTRQLMTSPLKDDFAVLKIGRVPEGLVSLPLDHNMNPQNIPKLSRFITLGFPLGNRTQADIVNASVTSGHVRRSFENLLQVDASLYGGNSGGPVIDTRGNVIGIVSGVAMDWGKGSVPSATPRWDIGMVLPITTSVEFLKELKAGQVKWNGELDFSVEESLKKIRETAQKGRWVEAQSLADEELTHSQQPELVMGAAMMHFCAGDRQGAKRLFSQSLSMDDENNVAKLMLYLIDWLAAHKAEKSYRAELLALDWRSPAEFQGYLVKVLEGMVDEASALDGWYSTSEKIWLNYAVALIQSRQTEWPGAEKRLREAVRLGETDGWEFFLARSELEAIQKRRRKTLDSEVQLVEYEADIEAFEQQIRKALPEERERQEKLALLKSQLRVKGSNLKEKAAVLEKIHRINPENRQILVGLAFYNAAEEAWRQALKYIGTFAEGGGRPYGEQMSLELLRAGILHYQGNDAEAQAGLEAFLRMTRDPWYQTIGEYLLGKQTEDFLKDQVGGSPENLITVSTALGFWSEGSGEKDKAIKYYNEALGTFLDTWQEYDFAKARLKRLKTP